MASLWLRPALVCARSARNRGSDILTSRVLRFHLSTRHQQLNAPSTKFLSSLSLKNHFSSGPSVGYAKSRARDSLPTEDTNTTPSSEANLTWRDYDPEGGLPLPQNDLSAAEIRKIFKDNNTSPDFGNWIIRLMNWRRQSGSLIEHGITFPAGKGISQDAARLALDYLRKTQLFVNEQVAGQRWAEEQAEILEESYVERAQRFRLYEDRGQDAELEQEQVQSPREERSVLVSLRKHHQARQRAEEEAEAEAKAKAEADAEAAAKVDADSVAKTAKQARAETHGAEQTARNVQSSIPDAASTGTNHNLPTQRPVQKAWLQPIDRKPWVKYYESQAHILKSDTVPDRTFLSRLWKPSLAVALVIAASLYVGETYSPPSSDTARLFPHMSQGTATLSSLIGVLVLCAMAYRIPPLWKTFNTYFLTIPGYPVASSMVLSMFCHASFAHLIFNCALLGGFGHFFHQQVDRGTFLATFIGTGAVAAWISLLVRVYKKQWLVYSFGASNAIYGVLAATCVLHTLRSTNEIAIFDRKIPVSVGTGIQGGMVLFEFLMARHPLTAAGVDYVGHFAGLLGGTIAAILIARRDEQRRKDSVGSVR